MGGLKLQGAPDAAAIGAISTFCIVRLYFIGGQITHLGLHGNLLGFAADTQLIDAAAFIFDTNTFDTLVAAVACLLSILELLRCLYIGFWRNFAWVLGHCRSNAQGGSEEEGGCAHP